MNGIDRPIKLFYEVDRLSLTRIKEYCARLVKDFRSKSPLLLYIVSKDFCSQMKQIFLSLDQQSFLFQGGPKICSREASDFFFCFACGSKIRHAPHLKRGWQCCSRDL